MKYPYNGVKRIIFLLVRYRTAPELKHTSLVRLIGFIEILDSNFCPHTKSWVFFLCTERIFEGNNNNIAIIAIQHSKTYFVDTFGDFSHTVE